MRLEHNHIMKFKFAFYKLFFVLGLVVALGVIFSSAPLMAASNVMIVKVGGYNFPPFVENDGKAGMVANLIEKLNVSQKKIKFIFVVTSANRRYRDFKDRKFDTILFEDENWGWRTAGVSYKKSSVILNGGELYVALNKPNRGQSYFDSFDGKKVRAIFGYHYNFANMKTDPEILRKKGVSLGSSNEDNLKDLLKGRVDIVVINSFMVEQYLKNHKNLISRFLISQKKDQVYNLRFLINSKAPVSPKKLEQLILPRLK
jgi:polar amino acid transport system substrate-binding protein